MLHGAFRLVARFFASPRSAVPARRLRLGVEMLEQRDVPSTTLLGQIGSDTTHFLHDAGSALRSVQPASLRRQLTQDFQTLRHDLGQGATSAVSADLNRLAADVRGNLTNLAPLLSNPTLQSDVNHLLADGQAVARMLRSSPPQATTSTPAASSTSAATLQQIENNQFAGIINRIMISQPSLADPLSLAGLGSATRAFALVVNL